ncbi:hypothetical protein TNCV_3640621 [Trichonephila clavipes]|nr:hypothetical protein TNCV_3640621 [Trichonephila clavipes]
MGKTTDISDFDKGQIVAALHLGTSISGMVQKINLNLFQPCNKRESAALLKQKGVLTIEELLNLAKNQVIAYTDGSSYSDLDKGGVGIYFIHPNAEQ